MWTALGREAAATRARGHGSGQPARSGAARPRAQPNVGFWQRLVEAESWLRPHGTAPLPPSTSIQQYKWSFLERCRPDASREHIVSELEATNREVEALLHRHDFTPVNV